MNYTTKSFGTSSVLLLLLVASGFLHDLSHGNEHRRLRGGARRVQLEQQQGPFEDGQLIQLSSNAGPVVQKYVDYENRGNPERNKFNLGLATADSTSTTATVLMLRTTDICAECYRILDANGREYRNVGTPINSFLSPSGTNFAAWRFEERNDGTYNIINDGASLFPYATILFRPSSVQGRRFATSIRGFRVTLAEPSVGDGFSSNRIDSVAGRSITAPYPYSSGFSPDGPARWKIISEGDNQVLIQNVDTKEYLGSNEFHQTFTWPDLTYERLGWTMTPVSNELCGEDVKDCVVFQNSGTKQILVDNSAASLPTTQTSVSIGTKFYWALNDLRVST